MNEMRMDTGGGAGGEEKMRSDMSTDHEPCNLQHVDQGISLGCRLRLCGDRLPLGMAGSRCSCAGFLRAE